MRFIPERDSICGFEFTDATIGGAIFCGLLDITAHVERMKREYTDDDVRIVLGGMCSHRHLRRKERRLGTSVWELLDTKELKKNSLEAWRDFPWVNATVITLRLK